MTNDQYLGFNTHAQQQKPILVSRVFLIKKLNRVFIIKNGLRFLKRHIVFSQVGG